MFAKQSFCLLRHQYLADYKNDISTITHIFLLGFNNMLCLCNKKRQQQFDSARSQYSPNSCAIGLSGLTKWAFFMSVQLEIIVGGINHIFPTKFSSAKDTMQITWSNAHPPIYVAMALLILALKERYNQNLNNKWILTFNGWAFSLAQQFSGDDTLPTHFSFLLERCGEISFTKLRSMSTAKIKNAITTNCSKLF